MSPLMYPRKVFLGWFVCDTCGRKLENHEHTADTMSIYCECGEEKSMRLYNVRLKIPVEYRDLNNKTIWVDKN